MGLILNVRYEKMAQTVVKQGLEAAIAQRPGVKLLEYAVAESKIIPHTCPGEFRDRPRKDIYVQSKITSTFVNYFLQCVYLRLLTVLLSTAEICGKIGFIREGMGKETVRAFL